MTKSLDPFEHAANLLSEDLIHAEPGSELELKIIMAHLIKWDGESKVKCARCQTMQITLLIGTGFSGEHEPLCAACISKELEEHRREIANMAKDAWDEATTAILDGRRTVGYCSFCNTSVVCHSLSEAQEKQREHILRCPEMHKALASIAEYHRNTSEEHEA